jgi:hypothetical protein
MAFDLRPEQVREIDVVVELNDVSDLADLQTLINNDTTAPVALRLPTETDVNTDLYGYVRSAEFQDRINPDDMTALVKIVTWDTA